MKQFLSIAISFLFLDAAIAATVRPSDQRARISRSGVYLSMPWSSTLSKIGGVRHPAVAQSKLVKTADSDTEMSFGIELDLKNEDQLISRLESIYDKSHPSFRKFYAPGEFKKLHEADANQKAVVSAIQKAGLKVTHTSGRHLRVNGKVSQINFFLNTQISEYENPQGVHFLSASHDAQVSKSLGIAAVLDLDTHPKIQKKSPLHQAMMTSFQKTLFELKSLFHPGSLIAQAAIPYNSLFIRAMYAIPANLTGTGQTMGINGLPFDPKDIALFWTSLGYAYAQPPVNIVSVHGSNITLTPGQADTETTVDITMAMSVAPQLKEIRVYDGNGTPYVAFNQAAVDNEVQVMTTSFTGEANPQQVAALNIVLMQMAAQGQSAFTASGDQGDWDPYILDPEDQPFITSVGGAVKGSGYVNGVTPVYPGEGTWSQSGGNISPTWPIPSYQVAAAKLNPQASQTMRNYPDVAAFSGSHYAPWYWIYVNGQNSGPWAGTSLSSPLWAALTCLVNENNQSQGLANMGFLNPAVYEIGASSDYHSVFHDMNDGVSNSASFNGQPASAGFNAVTGWDLVTGWGTPNSNLIPIFATYSKPTTPIPSTPLECGTWLEQYTIIPYKGYGTMPTNLQPQWNNLGCDQQVCTFFADKYGAVPNGTMGTLPLNEQAIWNTLKCKWVLQPLSALQIENKCGGWLEKHSIVPFGTWGTFAMPNRYFWNLWDCNHQICSFFERKYKAVPNGSMGTLPANEQAIWNSPSVNCNQFLTANPTLPE